MKVRLVGYFEPGLAQRVRNASLLIFPPALIGTKSSDGQPDFSHVAQGVLWLASDASGLVTGHALPLDAGWIAKRGG
jgi:NAD(P)-dependent dehydrogenase (short-subunit alcohol dehydrogenase family)